MARPTKEEIEQRKILELEFKRDNDEYLDFEHICKSFANNMGHECFMAYTMTRECELRTHRNFTKIREEVIEHGTRRGLMIVFPSGKKRKMMELTPITMISKYMDIGVSYPAADLYNIPHQCLKEWFMEDEESKEDAIQKYHSMLKRYKNDYFLLEYLCMPVIGYREQGSPTHKSALLNIDFTKPKEEIIAFVTKVKEQFDNDASFIQHLDNYLGLEPQIEPYVCNFTKCDIYTHKSSKTLEGRLADVLFIYDCHRLGLTKEYILNEINRYWNDVKNLHREKMSENTYYEYLDFAKKQIDEKGYEDFLLGIKNDK